MDKKSVAFGALRLAGRFYKWAFRSMFGLIKKSGEHISAIEEKKRLAAEASAKAVKPPDPPTQPRQYYS